MPFVEGCLYAGLLVWIFTRRPVQEQLRALTAPYRVAVLALVVAIPAGQLISDSEWTFPWVGWAMYTENQPGDVIYFEYSVVLANDEEHAWPVARQFSRIGKKVVWKLKFLERAGQTDVCDRVLRNLAGRSDRPVRTIRIWECVVPIEGYRHRGSVQRTLHREVPVP